jgi:hypothetical protein
MAKTAAEYQREYRERKAERAKNAGDPIDAIAALKFHEYLPTDGGWKDEVLYPLEWAGIIPDAVPAFDSDEDPDHNPETDGPYRGSIGRAERMVGMLLDAASGLASIINRYKRQQIDAAIADLEKADLTDPPAKKRALADIVRLNKLRDRLDKQVRWSLPLWKTEGE